MKKVDYKQAKIYRIEVANDATAPVYIGSTTKKYLSQRLSGHRSEYQRWKQGNKGSVTTSYKLFDEYGVDNCALSVRRCECTASKGRFPYQEHTELCKQKHCRQE